jgi:hypothetical protein
MSEIGPDEGMRRRADGGRGGKVGWETPRIHRSQGPRHADEGLPQDLGRPLSRACGAWNLAWACLDMVVQRRRRRRRWGEAAPILEGMPNRLAGESQQKSASGRPPRWALLHAGEGLKSPWPGPLARAFGTTHHAQVHNHARMEGQRRVQLVSSRHVSTHRGPSSTKVCRCSLQPSHHSRHRRRHRHPS